jgi:hypothetical protein
MARQLLATVRIEDEEEDLNLVDHQGLGLAIQELAAAYGSGSIEGVTPDSHVVKTKAVNEDGDIVGFNYYLVWGEPPVLGPLKKEPA